MLTRRYFGGAALAALTVVHAARPTWASAASREKRFIFIIQRGAADGLHSIIPLGDPALRSVRASLVDAIENPTRLDGFFSAHPALSQISQMFHGGEAIFAHAVASANRDRSHFDAQNILETGGLRAYAEKAGWMNRLIGLLPADAARALALSPGLPSAMRGPNPASNFAPTRLPDPSGDLLARVTDLYAHDAALRSLWQTALETRAMAGDQDGGLAQGRADAGALAARLMAPSDGARLMMIETGGWDTHSGQKARMNISLAALDRMVGSIKTGLGAAWADTVILVATEFGRTVAANGTGGSDHGTGAVAMLLGGAVKGGRIIADWPGLTSADLYDGRDLRPTMQLEALIAGVVAEHFSLDSDRLRAELYPSISNLKHVSGLIRA